MTKNEAIDAGRKAGQVQAEAMMNEVYLREKNDNEAANDSVAYANMHCADAKIRSSVYHDAYKAAFMQVYRNRHANLPEVKAENRKRSIDYTLRNLIEDADRNIADWTERLAKNPCDAFEWSDGAMQRAAEKEVALHLKAIVESEKGGIDQAVAYAVEQALRGARWPSHSTSTITNVMAEFKTAAFAEFAAKFQEQN
jgi:hypothetical protein